ncbi:hypothetical protein L798_11378 [Zootermopsis nevadensis]|uniref:Uncharacterized protein n=1 Tax=Zootermopsis nevadensis TaxID=136037 RepID=A0A067RSK6_ZOONE|nr:hypothetical protein L798_11378 [Zootermopsis nevadensis]
MLPVASNFNRFSKPINDNNKYGQLFNLQSLYVFQILLCLFVISSCSTTPKPNSLISTQTTTTEETSTDSELINIKHDQKTADITDGDIVTIDEDEIESSKRKRTIDQNLGYGYNDIAGRTRQTDQSIQNFGTYFPQNSQQPTHQPVRYYSPGSATNRLQQHVDNGHRPASSFNNHANTQESEYLAKSPTYRGPAAVSGSLPTKGAPVFSTPRSPHPFYLFPGSPPQAPAFFTGHSLTSPHNPFADVTSHNTQNPFLPVGNFHGGPLLYQHPGSSGVAFLQNPSGYFGPQIVPVIILRVTNDANGNNAFHHQSAVSPSLIQTGMHGLNLQTLLYPVQQFHTPQQNVFPRYYATHNDPASQQLVQNGYQSGETPKTHYVQPPATTATQIPQQKISYVQQNTPLTPTPSPDSTQKLRKTDVNETGPLNEYKYEYKDKV